MFQNNKAHATTVNRILKRYGGIFNVYVGPDILAHDMVIEVETAATLRRGVRELKKFPGPSYVAVTNKEAIADALRLTQGTHIGVMDPRGEIIKPAKMSAPAAAVTGPASQNVALSEAG